MGVYSYWKKITNEFSDYNIIGDVFEIIYDKTQESLYNYELYELKEEVFKLGNLKEHSEWKIYGDLPNDKEKLIKHIERYNLDIKPIKKTEKREVKYVMDYIFKRYGDVYLTILSNNVFIKNNYWGEKEMVNYSFIEIFKGEMFIDTCVNKVFKFINCNQHKHSQYEYDRENNTSKLTFKLMRSPEEILEIDESDFDTSYEEEDFIEHEEDYYYIPYNVLVEKINYGELVKVNSYFDMYNTCF